MGDFLYLRIMNYQLIHDNIIDRAKTRVLPKDTYTERHHIIPRCMGGSDDKSNLVDLTGSEHFVIHQLLCEIYPNNTKLLSALWGMSNQKGGNNKRDYKVSSKQYERFRIAHSIHMKEILTKDFSEFKESINTLYGNKFNVDNCASEYLDRKHKINVTCKNGHIFPVTPDNLLRGKGCPKCLKRNKTQEEVINEIAQVHGSTYDTSNIVYENSKTKLKLSCNKHGEFKKLYYDLVNLKQGCPDCAQEEFADKLKEKVKNKFFEKTKKMYGEIYDLSNVKYVDSTTEVELFCKKHETHFNKKPVYFLQGSICPICSKEQFTKKTKGVKKPKIREKLGKKMSIDGIIYFSREHASEMTGITVYKIRQRLKSDLFPNYFYV